MKPAQEGGSEKEIAPAYVVHEDLILKEQVRQVFSLAPIGFLATIMNSLIVFVVLQGAAPRHLVQLWLGGLFAATAVRALLVVAFHRAGAEFDAGTWQKRYLWSIVLIGLAWGSISFIPFSFSLAHQVFIAFVLGGMAAGASSTFSKLRHGFLAFALPSLIPLALHFFAIADTFHYSMGFMAVTYLVLLARISRHNYLVNRDSLLLRFENQDIIADLKEANREVDALNRQLLAEIAAKKEAEGEIKKHHEHLARTVEERTADLSRANEQLRTEIEERKEIERALRQSRERLFLAQIAGRVGIFDWDVSSGETIWTPELEELFGLRPGEFERSYAAWASRVHPADLREVEEAVRRRMEERADQLELEYRFLRADGALRWMAATARISYDAQGSAQRMIGTLVDITEMKEVQEKLTAARDAAEVGSKAKSEFLANMSHEMRTPLAGVLGMINLVLDMRIGDEERELLSMAKHSAESLLRLIEDVLDFSRLEAGVMRFERKAFSIREVVRSAVEVVSLSARERGIDLTWEVDERAPGLLEGDAGRVRQVLVNLLGNAVKFTEQGRIEVAVRPCEQTPAPQGEGLLFSVKDTGVGIPAEQLERIFAKFTQIDSSLTRRYGGTGLGLALSRQIVEKMGGRIWAESSTGAGSTFFFTIPASP